MKRWWLWVGLVFCIGFARADVEVFTLRAANPDEAVATLRAALGNRAQINVVQQKLVVVGEAKALQEAASILRKVDRLPANLRLTLTENPPTESVDPSSGVLVYTTDRNSQVVDTLEGAMLSLDYTKFHQTVSSDGWLVSIDNQPIAVQQMQMRVRLAGARSAEIMLSYVRYVNQERKVYGRIIAGEMGTWIPLLPERVQPSSDGNSVQYDSGPKPGEQLYLKIEKVLVPTRSTRADG